MQNQTQDTNLASYDSTAFGSNAGKGVVSSHSKESVEANVGSANKFQLSLGFLQYLEITSTGNVKADEPAEKLQPYLTF